MTVLKRCIGIRTQKKPYRVSRWSVSENAVILDTCGLVRMAHTEAMYCESCGKIIIDVPMQ